MNSNGFVTEDDLILYAMQASSEQEMAQAEAAIRRDPALANRLEEIRSVLGLYANAAAESHEVPSGALQRLQSRIERERVMEPASATPFAGRGMTSEPSALRRWRVPLLWSGWAVATVMLIVLGLLIRQGHSKHGQIAVGSSASQGIQQQLASIVAERDQLRASMQQQRTQLDAEREKVEQAQSRADQLTARSAALSAKVTESELQAARTTAKVDALTATANQNQDERRKLGEALTREQQLAASAAESQQVLAALADPSALHVTLTVPKEQKRPSGRGTYLASTGALVFTGSNLAGLPADKVYELWLLPANGAAPVPAGTFRPDSAGNATLITSHFEQRVAATGFAITIENAGGSTTPTMPIILVGAA